MTGAITAHIDVAQLALYAFWIFFICLIFYLRREDRREGYPLESEVTGELRQDTAIWMPKPKFWSLPDGGKAQAPAAINEPPLNAKRISHLDGAPYEPVGDPLAGGFGPAAYALRDDKPDRTGDGHNKIVPLSALSEFDVLAGGTDPRGFDVRSGDGKVVGQISDIWIDRSECLVRYYEISLSGAASSDDGEGSAPSPRRVLVPAPMATVRKRGRTGVAGGAHVNVRALRAEQFADVPTTQSADSVTRLEEDKISAFYAGAEFFNHRATPPGSIE